MEDQKRIEWLCFQQLVQAFGDGGAEARELLGAQYDPGLWALHDACRDNSVPVDAVRSLLERGADPNLKCQGKTPLQLASNCHNVEKMRALIEHGADVPDNCILQHLCQDWTSEQEVRNDVGLRTLMDRCGLLAPREQDHSVLRMLVEMGVDMSGVPWRSLAKLSDHTIFLLENACVLRRAPLLAMVE